MADLEQESLSSPAETIGSVFVEEYPNAEVRYIDYTSKYDELTSQGKEVSPRIHQTKDDVFVNPYGNEGGNYRLPLILGGIDNSLPDPNNAKNRYLIYPSFDEQNNVTTIRILRYPTETLKKINDMAIHANLGNSISNTQDRMATIPTVRFVSSKSVEGIHVGTEGFKSEESSLTRTVSYSSEKLQKIKDSSKARKWGESSLLTYKNNHGEKRVLIVT